MTIRPGGLARQHARVVAVVRDDADLGVVERRVGLDAVDERRAARRRREQALERDDARPPFGDDLERAQRVGVGERQQLAVESDARSLRAGRTSAPPIKTAHGSSNTLKS